MKRQAQAVISAPPLARLAAMSADILPLQSWPLSMVNAAYLHPAATMSINFELPAIHDNADGSWGPSSSTIPSQFKE